MKLLKESCTHESCRILLDMGLRHNVLTIYRFIKVICIDVFLQQDYVGLGTVRDRTLDFEDTFLNLTVSIKL